MPEAEEIEYSLLLRRGIADAEGKFVTFEYKSLRLPLPKEIVSEWEVYGGHKI